MKKITMKNFVIGCAAISLFLTACGDDVTNDSVVKAEAYESKADLPDCGEKYEGMFATVPSKKEVYLCSEGSWKSLLNSSTASAVKDGEFACSTVELKDKSGYKVVCGGDSVAVVKNGANGSNGSQGPAGPSGAPGESGSDGTGSNGKDLTLGKDDCAVMYTGLETVVYDCGDSAYVKDLSGYKASLKTWNALSLETSLMNTAGTSISNPLQMLHLSEGASSQSELVRWEGDKLTASTAVTSNDLRKTFALRGKASLTVNQGAVVWTGVPLEPMMGISMQLKSSTDIRGWGGYCVTYEAQKDMEFIVSSTGAPFNIARAVLKASSKETTVNISFSEFIPDDQNVKLEDILKKVMYTYVKVVGSLDEGTYTNEFAVYEIGAYGRCNGPTVADFETKAKELFKTGTFTDKRDNKKYNTVTIGDQTWFAQDLDYEYKVHVDPDHDKTDTKFACGTETPCVQNLTYRSTDPAVSYHGLYYSWSAAIDSAKLARDATAPRTCGYDQSCVFSEPVQGVCPVGWHLPSNTEFDELFASVKKLLFDGKYDNLVASSMLESESNLTGFSALLNGYRSANGSSIWNESESRYWVSTEKDATSAWYSLIYGTTAQTTTGGGKAFLRAVRCIKDKAKE